MRTLYILSAFLLLYACQSSDKEQISVEGLKESVEILRDKWGVNHIYANNQHDLFFAQGYAAAKDRLFQFEIWRRQATGTVAELLGERELKRDIGTRLFKFRGDMKTEMNHYHKDGEEIITAYTDGVNAYIEEILQTPEKLPVEFKILNIVPEKWTPEVVISRHQGLLGNINKELETGRAVARLGAETTKSLSWFHPQDPDINLDPSINKELLFDDILELYNAYRAPLRFEQSDIRKEFQSTDASNSLSQQLKKEEDMLSIGSNNWVVSKERTVDGNTYMANDPHRAITVPSLRYMVHLVAPGWDVIGGGEPEIPGISIGHNEYGAWGLTIFSTDAEDLYVYDINPENLKQYLYRGEWMDMNVISEQINVKNQDPTKVELLYTRHGPVVYVDSIHHKAYAVRCGWLEIGGAPYLASLRFGQAKNWEEFRDACSYSHIPGENMIWADKEGNIGWQAVGIAPIRRNFSGLIPVPGDGRYEWEGYIPIKERPHMLNPSKGFFATANQNVTPDDYEHWDAIGFSWSDPFRGDRINEVLGNGNKFTMEDMRALQVDYLSIPARTLVPMLDSLSLSGRAADARSVLRDWDFKLNANSIEAAIYVAWENEISDLAARKFIPTSAKEIIGKFQLAQLISWIKEPENRFGPDPLNGRDAFLKEAFEAAITYLEETLGSDMNYWQYGQEKFKHTHMQHALSSLVNEETKAKLDLKPLPRGGNAYTVGSTGINNRQTTGASFRLIVNTGDWDAAISTNGPGQSGDPESAFYSNLYEPWANDEYFPLYYSKDKILAVTADRIVLDPGKTKE